MCGLFTYGSATAKMIIGQIWPLRCFDIWVHNNVLSESDNWSPCSGCGVYSSKDHLTAWSLQGHESIIRSKDTCLRFFFSPSCVLTVLPFLSLSSCEWKSYQLETWFKYTRVDTLGNIECGVFQRFPYIYIHIYIHVRVSMWLYTLSSLTYSDIGIGKFTLSFGVWQNLVSGPAALLVSLVLLHFSELCVTKRASWNSPLRWRLCSGLILIWLMLR